jgi:hypothetical protein
VYERLEHETKWTILGACQAYGLLRQFPVSMLVIGYSATDDWAGCSDDNLSHILCEVLCIIVF